MFARISLRIKITSLVVIMVAVASIAFGRFAYSGIGNILTESTGFGAETSAEALAGSIDGEWLRRFTLSAVQSEQYEQMQKRLEGPILKGTVAVLEVTRIDRQASTVLHVFSLPADGSGDYIPPGTVESIQTLPIYAKRESGHLPVRLARPGYFMAGWAPIHEGEEIIGMLILTIDVSNVKAALDTVSLTIAITMLALVFLSGLVAYKFAATFEKTAVTDGLMQIYNHKYFKQRLEEEVAKARRYGQPTSVVFLDIDFFKRVNDTYGHATGDIVLKQMAKWVTDSTRTTDVVARYGGEEVAVILPHTGIAGAQEFSERLRIKISEQYIHDPEENAKFRVTVSVGVAQWEKGLNMMDLLKRADAALYHSKNTGRNRVTIYQDEILSPNEHGGR